MRPTPTTAAEAPEATATNVVGKGAGTSTAKETGAEEILYVERMRLALFCKKLALTSILCYPLCSSEMFSPSFILNGEVEVVLFIMVTDGVSSIM